MSYVGAQPSIRRVSYMQQVYATLTGMFLFAGGVGFAVSRAATHSPTGIQCALFILGLVFMGAVTYSLRKEGGLNALCLLLFMAIVGWFGGVLTLEHEIVVVTCYLCVLTSFGTLWAWSLASTEKLNFWYGFVWCVLTSLAVLWCVQTAYPTSKEHLLPIGGVVSVITQVYLLCSSAGITQEHASNGVITGASSLLFKNVGDVLFTYDTVEVLWQGLFEVLWQILSSFWWV